jgi:hypothetical protein
VSGSARRGTTSTNSVRDTHTAHKHMHAHSRKAVCV